MRGNDGKNQHTKEYATATPTNKNEAQPTGSSSDYDSKAGSATYSPRPTSTTPAATTKRYKQYNTTQNNSQHLKHSANKHSTNLFIENVSEASTKKHNDKKEE